jgi:hypothetical protein
MNKKMTTALLALTLLIPTTAHAALKNQSGLPTLAIIDTGIDGSVKYIKDKIVHEVCLLEYNSCPNGQSFMEGPGSAVVNPAFVKSNGFNHGTNVAATAILSNPDIQIVFIRIIANRANGTRENTSEQSITNALNWVSSNKDKFNIQAVSISQTHHNLKLYKNYCPINMGTEASIRSLTASGVPVFVAVGQVRDYERIDWPACIPEAVAIGQTTPADSIHIQSNADVNLTDFYALGVHNVIGVDNKSTNISGSSFATPYAAAGYIKIKTIKPNLSYSEVYNLISKTSIPTSNAKVPSGKLINIQGAING